MDTTRAYYERRALEYERTSWGELDDEEAAAVRAALAGLPPARTLDVGCGTGFLTTSLRGSVLALDQSEAMLREARAHLPGARFVRGEAARLPFVEGAFDRVFASHVYGHLRADEREAFLDEARRVGAELVIVDERVGEGLVEDGLEERTLEDGSRHRIHKRRFTPGKLLGELGGGEVLFEGNVHLVVRCR